MKKHAAVLLLLIGATPLLAEKSVPVPREVSDAERGAVVVATHYLSGGAASVWDDLSSDSPLRRLGRDAALREITARCGPTKDAKWELETVVPSLKSRMAAFSVVFPSGADDALTFDMALEKDAWKVRTISTSAEPVPRRVFLAPRVEPPPPNPLVTALNDPHLALALALPATLLSITGMALSRSRRKTGRIVIAVAALAFFVSTASMVAPRISRKKTIEEPAQPPPVMKAPQLVRLGALVDLRNAVASGDDRAMAQKWNAGSDAASDVANLWQAQLLLIKQQAMAAHLKLDAIPRDANAAMVYLLRARLAYLERDAANAVIAYEHAIDIGPGRDHLWMEAAEMLSILGYDDRGIAYLRRTAAIGSRENVAFFAAAELAALDDDEGRAESLLLAGWRLHPVERGEIIGMPLLWHVIRRPAVSNALQLFNASEASFATPSSNPITVPAGTIAEVCGDFLRLRIGDAELAVAGGGSFAPAGVKVIDAGAWRRGEEEKALARFAEIVRNATPGAMTQPAFLEQCRLTAYALAAKNRWNDLVTLTAALPADDERVPTDVTVLRARALEKLGRSAELRPLVLQLLGNPSLKRKKDPVDLRMTAELLADINEYDAAAKLLTRVRGKLESSTIDHRITQLMTEKALAEKFAVLSTAHLDVHYPKINGLEPSIQQLSTILEAEYQRLRATWFPRASERRVTVNVLEWEQFEEYSGSEYIAGLYTNQVFLPLAGVNEFPPEIVAIGTHELAHAFIADWTRNLAPRWFHEALASRVEMVESPENAFKSYEPSRLLSVAVLDDVAGESPDPELIGETYRVGESTLRFIEARYGRAAIARMLDAFAAGADSDAAVRAATRLSIGDLDQAARQWGAAQPTVFPPDEIVHYGARKVRVRGGVISFGQQ